MPDVSLAHHPNYREMDSLTHGPTNALRNAVKTIRILMNDRREYLVGIALLLIVVFLWALSNFVTQVRANPLLVLSMTDHAVVECRIFSKEDMRNPSCASESWSNDQLFVTITLTFYRFCRVTWLNTSAFALYLIPPGLKKLLGKESRDVPHHGACAISSRLTSGV